MKCSDLIHVLCLTPVENLGGLKKTSLSLTVLDTGSLTQVPEASVSDDGILLANGCRPIFLLETRAYRGRSKYSGFCSIS